MSDLTQRAQRDQATVQSPHTEVFSEQAHGNQAHPYGPSPENQPRRAQENIAQALDTWSQPLSFASNGLLPNDEQVIYNGLGSTPLGSTNYFDSFDWLWVNNISEPLLPTTFWEADPGAILVPTDRPSQEHTPAPRAEGLRVLENIYSHSIKSKHSQDYTGNVSDQTYRSGIVEPGTTIRNAELTNAPVPQSAALANQNRDGNEAPRLDEELRALGDTSLACPWRISASQFETIRAQILANSAVLPPHFTIPTRHTLSRYMEGYFRGFHEHLPFFHTSTFSVSTLPVGLLLSIAALGALYKYEHDTGYTIYFAAKAITNNDLRCQRECVAAVPTQRAHGDGGLHAVEQQTPSTNVYPRAQHHTGPELSCQKRRQEVTTTSKASLRTMQALIVLTAMSAWGRGDLVSDSLESASQIAVLLRTNGLNTPDCITDDITWEEWIAIEEKRRTLFAGFTLLNLQSLAFNVPPPLMNREVMLSLPHPMDMWRAETETEWKRIQHEREHREATFASVLGSMLCGVEIDSTVTVSALGNYILIHGLVQHIFVQRQSLHLDLSEQCLEQATLDRMDKALRSWQHCWSRAHESTLDPLSRNGPVAFNSTALLRIAYIRLTVDLGPYRSVMTRNPECLAKSVCGATGMSLTRSPSTDLAILQCTHALGIIVNQGVAFVSRTHAQSWSIVHSLSHIECACLMSFWLQNMAALVQTEGEAALRSEERKLLRMITTFVNETMYASRVHGDDDAGVVGRIWRLAAFTVRIWADALRGEHIFNMVKTISDGLSLAADKLIERFEG